MAVPSPSTYENLTFEKVWAMFEETDRRMKETDRRMKETDRLIGNLGNRFGELADHLVAPGIIEKFNELGYHFDSVTNRGITIYGENKKFLTEIDILLENTDFMIAVEVKVKPGEKDIEHHIKRMEILREYRSRQGYKRKMIRGAIAGAIFPENIKNAVLETGMYVLEQSGDTMRIEAPKEANLREW